MWYKLVFVSFFFSTILIIEPISSQCYSDRHNTSLEGMWLSCSVSSSPNPARSRGYWVMYELEERQAVSSLKIWNINHPDHLESGIKTFDIEYRNVHGSWIKHSTHSLEKAEASGFYEGEDIALDGEFVTDRILLTFTENHGGDCFGMSEVRIGLIDKTTSTEDISAEHFDVEISPNPFADFTSITIRDLTEKEIKYEILNSVGQVVKEDIVSTQNGTTQIDLQSQGWPSGTFLLKITDGIRISSRKLSHQIN